MTCALSHLGGCNGRVQWHHPLPKQAIKRKFPHGAIWKVDHLQPVHRHDDRLALELGEVVTLDDLLGDTRNRIWLCPTCHQNVEWKRVYVDPPESAWAFAVELGLSRVFERSRERRAA